MALETPDSLLDFWIGPARDDAVQAKARSALWFRKSFETDALIADRFLDTLSALASGLAYDWAVTSPAGRLAAIIALDQFSRNMFRDTPAAFAHDAMALDLCSHGLMLGVDMGMKEVERQFFYMPLEHSERLSDQDLCVKAMGGALRSARPPFKPILEGALDYAKQHQAIIQRFARFPHRNPILGRTNTPEEAAYLAEPGSGF
ncbi:MAG: DUF924 family protein [Pseudomonadota bacterium]